jgi:hypothetical protein
MAFQPMYCTRPCLSGPRSIGRPVMPKGKDQGCAFPLSVEDRCNSCGWLYTAHSKYSHGGHI